MNGLTSAAANARKLTKSALVFVLLVGMIAALPIVAGAAKPSSATVTVDDGKFASVGMAYVDSSGAKAGTAKLATATGADGMLVKAECFQDGVIVYRQYSRVDNGSAPLTLGPTPSWTEGSADCTAELGEFDKRTRWRSADSDTFHVEG